MATLTEAPAQLQEWIDALDGEIATLKERRASLVVTLTIFGQHAPTAAPAEPAPTPLTPRPAAIAKPATAPSKPKPNRSAAAPSKTYDYALVARVAIAAQKAGEPTARAVAEHLNITESTARILIAAARDKGYEIPKLSKGGRRSGSNVTPIHRAPPPVTAGNHPARFSSTDAIRELERQP